MDVKLKLLTEFSTSTNGQVNSAVDSTVGRKYSLKIHISEFLLPYSDVTILSS